MSTFSCWQRLPKYVASQCWAETDTGVVLVRTMLGTVRGLITATVMVQLQQSSPMSRGVSLATDRKGFLREEMGSLVIRDDHARDGLTVLGQAAGKYEVKRDGKHDLHGVEQKGGQAAKNVQASGRRPGLWDPWSAS